MHVSLLFILCMYSGVITHIHTHAHTTHTQFYIQSIYPYSYVHVVCIDWNSIKIESLVCNACHVWVASDNIKSHSSESQEAAHGACLTGFEIHYV